MRKPLLTAALVAAAATLALPLHAQTPAGKKELVAKIIQLQTPGIENIARQLVEQPAMALLQSAAPALQRIPAERRDAVGRDIEADVRKYVEDAGPVVRDRALKLAPGTLGPLLEERFNEDELKQIIAMMESPVLKRYQQSLGELQRTMTEKVVADTRGQIEPKLKALQEGTAKRLGITPPAAGASGAKKP